MLGSTTGSFGPAAGRVAFGIAGPGVGVVPTEGVVVGSIGLHVTVMPVVHPVQILVPVIYVVPVHPHVPPVVPVLVVVVAGDTVR